jgi:argininosuccinate lyase
MPQDNAPDSPVHPAAKPWGGRFSEATDAFVEEFTASVAFDQRLYAQDITGSIAHARMLAAVGVLTETEADTIVRGLEAIRAEIESGAFTWSVAREDVHMNIEARLIEKIGETGKKLHTGRSRNDQVATDIRLWLREAIDALLVELRRYQRGLLDLAEREHATVMPGFTHLQTAQPVTFGHHMMAWYEMLERDAERLSDCRAPRQPSASGRRCAGRHQLPAGPGAHGASARLRRCLPQLAGRGQ